MDAQQRRSNRDYSSFVVLLELDFSNLVVVALTDT